MGYNWNGLIFFEPSLDGTHTYLETLIWGANWTIATTLGAFTITLTLGSIVGVARTSPLTWIRASTTNRPGLTCLSSNEIT
ncbi:hypothetical protein AFK24_26130 [Pseudomonas syringae]|uniref:Amino acid ABC transporter permease n=2 Tax=Pseudomonas syringae TaxID=317 RepID=A0A1C7YXV9_PSESX|nr:hypothetical protein AFK24_26130 [Pseudomonas syringae]